MSKKELVREILKEIIEMLSTEVSISQKYPHCVTTQIQYFDKLSRNCQERYEEIYSLNFFDIKQKKLLEYLKESLIRMRQEEGNYNQQSALLICQNILKREEE